MDAKVRVRRESFALAEKWNPKKQAKKLQGDGCRPQRQGRPGWKLLGLHLFDLVGGITGSTKGTKTLTLWKRKVK